MRTNPRPTRATIGFYYPAHYAPFLNTRVPDGVPHGTRRPLWKRLVKRVLPLPDTRATCLPDMPAGNLIEIGCASGLFLHQMQTLGWDVRGIEPGPTAAAEARALGFPVHAGPLETAPDPPSAVDLVVGWMVLEHLHEPLLGLRRIHQWLRPAGWLALSVPDCAAWDFRYFRDKAFALHLPNHLFHFTEKTLNRMLAEAGFAMRRVFHHHIATNLLVDIGYARRARGWDDRLTRWLVDYPFEAHQGSTAWTRPLGLLLGWARQSGRITVWAQRS